ncbi:hypothetical protein [Amycolatopsis benzoatilytica]|uniref:hypothetical protein n=1 Tax=Amycolatopsis benzoatilytica TaxID=346045 RepID=UPI001B7FB653|nr:hypothetical protein [Amycolatopsis benzoatilytica]
MAFTGLALPVSAPGAGAAQPADTGNAHLAAAPHSAVVPRDGAGQVQQAPSDDDWIPLLCLAGLLVAVPVGYYAYARRQAA